MDQIHEIISFSLQVKRFGGRETIKIVKKGMRTNAVHTPMNVGIPFGFIME